MYLCKQGKSHLQLSLFSSSIIAKANKNILLFASKAIAINNFSLYHSYNCILSTLINGLQYLKFSIQGSNDQKTIILSRFPSYEQSTTISRFDSFIATNNLGNFSKDSSCEPKRCLITFCFTTHTLHMIFYTCNAILFLPVYLQLLLKDYSLQELI